MLGLATHEPNFTIIREEFKPNKPRPCALCGQMGHEIKDCQGLAREKQGEVIDSSSPSINHLNSMYELIFCVFSLSMMNLQTQFQYQNRSSYSSDCLCYERFVCSNLKKWFSQKWKCAQLEAIQDIDEFVFQIWRNLAWHHLLSNGSSAVYVGYLWIIVMFLSAVWTLILTAPIHRRGSIAETVMLC